MLLLFFFFRDNKILLHIMISIVLSVIVNNVYTMLAFEGFVGINCRILEFQKNVLHNILILRLFDFTLFACIGDVLYFIPCKSLQHVDVKHNIRVKQRVVNKCVPIKRQRVLPNHDRS